MASMVVRAVLRTVDKLSVFSPKLSDLANALSCLPGVGYRSAQRMVFSLIDSQRESAARLSDCLKEALEGVRHCEICRCYTEISPCRFCLDVHRQNNRLCVIETAADMLAIEETGSFSGRYFVLCGVLSPLDGLGPQELGMPWLLERVQKESIEEVLIATNASPEGDATAYYLKKMLPDIAVTRLALGIPVGGQLEWLDTSTLAHAIDLRQEVLG